VPAPEVIVTQIVEEAAAGIEAFTAAPLTSGAKRERRDRGHAR
jgi:hypothetical protein